MDNLTFVLFLCINITMIPMTYMIPDKSSKLFIAYSMLGTLIYIIASSINSVILGWFAGDMAYVSTNIAPIVEEILKALPVLYFALVFSDESGTLALISYAMGLGFALFENIVILTDHVDEVTVIWACVRGFGAARMHSACTSLVGQGICYVRKRRKLFYCGTFSLLIAASTIHALFNMLIQSKYRNGAFLVVVLMYLPTFLKAIRDKGEGM